MNGKGKGDWRLHLIGQMVQKDPTVRTELADVIHTLEEKICVKNQ